MCYIKETGFSDNAKSQFDLFRVQYGATGASAHTIDDAKVARFFIISNNNNIKYSLNVHF